MQSPTVPVRGKWTPSSCFHRNSGVVCPFLLRIPTAMLDVFELFQIFIFFAIRSIMSLKVKRKPCSACTFWLCVFASDRTRSHIPWSPQSWRLLDSRGAAGRFQTIAFEFFDVHVRLWEGRIDSKPCGAFCDLLRADLSPVMKGEIETWSASSVIWECPRMPRGALQEALPFWKTMKKKAICSTFRIFSRSVFCPQSTLLECSPF